MPIPVTEMGLPDDVSALYDRVTRLERRRSATPIGYAAVTTTGGSFVATPGAGSTVVINSGWTLDSTFGTPGLDVVAGVPTYAPGSYVTQIVFVINFASTGPVLAAIDETGVVGNCLFMGIGSGGLGWSFAGQNYISTPTATQVEASWVQGTGTSLTVTDVFIYAMRVGDAP